MDRNGKKVFFNTIKVKGQEKGMPLTPEMNGEVNYQIGQINQPYNMNINVKTNKNMGPPVSGKNNVFTIWKKKQ